MQGEKTGEHGDGENEVNSNTSASPNTKRGYGHEWTKESGEIPKRIKMTRSWRTYIGRFRRCPYIGPN